MLEWQPSEELAELLAASAEQVRHAAIAYGNAEVLAVEPIEEESTVGGCSFPARYSAERMREAKLAYARFCLALKQALAEAARRGAAEGAEAERRRLAAVLPIRYSRGVARSRPDADGR